MNAIIAPFAPSVSSTFLPPFVSSVVETQIRHARPHGISTALDANGFRNILQGPATWR